MKSLLHLFSRRFIVISLSILTLSISYTSHAEWQRINPGGGGAFNSVGVGPTGLVVATSDLGGAYISRNSGTSWESVGDISHGLQMKHVQSVAFHPTNENIILLSGERTGSGGAGESIGISRSSNKGQSFAPVSFSSDPGSNIVVKSIAFAPSNGNIVYASIRSQYNAQDSKIYKSTDAGATFSLAADLTSTISNPTIMKLAIHPADPNTILALSEDDRFSNGQADNALLLSTNGGTSWSQVANTLSDMVDVVFHPTPDSNNVNHVYISTYDSNKMGKTFYCSDIEINPNSCTEIHSQNDHKGFLWPIAGNDQQIRSIDSTFSWYWGASHPVAWRIFHNGSSWNSEVLAYNRDYTGSTAESWRAGWSRTHTVFGTIIGGETAKTLGYDLTYTDNDTIFWVTIQFAFKGTYSDSGTPTLDFLPAYTTENSSTSDLWQSTGIDNITATLIEANDTDPDTLYIGLQDIGCWVSQDAGSYWKSCNFFHDYLNPLPDDWRGVDFSSGTNEYEVAFGGNVYALLSDPADPSNVWMSSSPSQGGDQTLTYSNDYGQNWIIATNTPTGASEVYGLSLDSTDSSHETLLVTIDGNVHRTTDGKNTSGATWSQISSPCSGGCRATSIDLNGTYYAGGEAGLFYSTNDGSNWTEFSGPINGGFSSSQGEFHGSNWQGVTNIRSDETTTGVVFISVFKSENKNTDSKGGIYRCDMNLSTPACTQLLGASVSAMGATPYIRDVAVNPSNPNILYASSSAAYTGPSYNSTAKGLYRSIDSGSTWSLENDGMSWSSSFPLTISSADPNLIYTGSIGPGYYKRDFAASTVANYQDDFQGPNPTSGWSYLWNNNGVIGNASNYTDLSWNGYHYDSDGISGVDSSEFAYGRLKTDGAHPGKAASQGPANDRFAIVAYQVSLAGNYSIDNSFITNPDCGAENGVDVRVYVNNTLSHSIIADDTPNLDFDTTLGSLQTGDIIYVAFGPNGNDGCDGVTFDFSIEK